MSDYQISSTALIDLIHFVCDSNSAPELTIMCNLCMSTDVIFFSGESMWSGNTDWLSAATVHMYDKHPEMTKT